MTIRQQTPQGLERVRSIQFVEVGNQTHIPAPFLRITTCGLLTIEVVEEIVSIEPPLARYISLTPEQLRGRGTAPALTLLKLLLSCPERFALKDWLMNQFCRDRELFSNVRLDNIASQLRSLLCPDTYEGLRKHLVALVRNSPASGDGYQLAAYPLIWTDIDALTRNAEQAARMERFGDDPLLSWERAYALAKRGVYLPDEVYSDWSAIRRGEISGVLRQSVQALARLYLLRHGKAGEEEALLLLRNYWLEHPREEDVLRPLMELLGQRECYQEALDYYQQLCALLEDERLLPDSRTRDVAEYVRTKLIQRKQAREGRGQTGKVTLLPFFLSDQAKIGTIEPFSQIATQDIIQKMSDLFGEADMDTLRRAIAQYALGITAAAIASPYDLDLLERFSRALSKPSRLDETVLSELENHAHSYWQHRLQATFLASDLLTSARTHFSLVTRLLQGALSLSERNRLCAIGSETAQVIGMLLFDLRAYEQARKYFHIAIRAAQEAEHSLLEMVAWGNLSFAWIYDDDPQKALPCIQKARMLSLVNKNVPLMLQAEFASREAEVFSYLGENNACLGALDAAEQGAVQETPTTLLFGIHFDIARWTGYQGACFRRLYCQDDQETCTFLPQAEQALQTALLHIPLSQQLRRSTLELDLAEVFLQQKEVERASQHALQAAIITERTGSQMMTRRLWTFRQQMGKKTSALIQSLDHELALLMTSQERKEEIR